MNHGATRPSRWRDEGPSRADVYDLAVLAFAHVGDYRLYAQERPDHIHLQDPLELRALDHVYPARAQRHGLHHGRIVHQDIDPAETPQGFGGHRFYLRDLGHVRAGRQTLYALSLEFLGDRLRRRPVDISHHHVGALLTEPASVCPPTAVTGPGNDGCQTVQTPVERTLVHGCVPIIST